MAQGLIELSTYKTPELPADERVQTLLTHLRTTFFPNGSSNVIAGERLETPALRRLDAAAHPPASGPVVEEIAHSVDDWRSTANPAQPLLAIVLPPGDDNDAVQTWAERDGCAVLDAPSDHGEPLDLARLDRLESGQFIVIPKLEAWFLRTPAGLRRIRHLLAELAARRQRAVVGCNSFAWSFLSRAVGIDNFAGKAMTFRPFDAKRLETWLSGLAEVERKRGVRFRLVDKGDEIFSGEDETLSHEFFLRLAGYSLGIPWVAWQMWRSVLWIEDHAPEAASERQHFWVSPLEELVLPGDYPREFLFALHAIALHGALAPAALDQVLPEGASTDMVATLVGSRLTEFQNGRLQLQPEAYPAVRSGLRSAGFPVGVI